MTEKTIPGQRTHELQTECKKFTEKIENFQEFLSKFNEKVKAHGEEMERVKVQIGEEKKSVKDLAIETSKKTESLLQDASHREIELEKFKLQYALLFGEQTVPSVIAEN